LRIRANHASGSAVLLSAKGDVLAEGDPDFLDVGAQLGIQLVP
jgi:hypothetical protein